MLQIYNCYCTVLYVHSVMLRYLNHSQILLRCCSESYSMLSSKSHHMYIDKYGKELVVLYGHRGVIILIDISLHNSFRLKRQQIHGFMLLFMTITIRNSLNFFQCRSFEIRCDINVVHV